MHIQWRNLPGNQKNYFCSWKHSLLKFFVFFCNTQSLKHDIYLSFYTASGFFQTSKFETPRMLFKVKVTFINDNQKLGISYNFNSQMPSILLTFQYFLLSIFGCWFLLPLFVMCLYCSVTTLLRNDTVDNKYKSMAYLLEVD